jgi:hypothetical protein
MNNIIKCYCAHNLDGTTTTTMLCPQHAEHDPCYTFSLITGKRRKGSIVKGKCNRCSWAKEAN